MDTQALLDTLADPVAKAKAGKPFITQALIRPQVLIYTLAN